MSKSANILLEIANNASTEFLGKHQKVGKFMLERTKEILNREGKDVSVYLKPNVWKTCASEDSLQYGEKMIRNIIENRRGARRYYYCFTMDNNQYAMFVVSSNSKNKMYPESKLASAMLEEIAHVLATARAGHGKRFSWYFIYLWRKYFSSLKSGLKEIIRKEENENILS